MYKRRPCQHRLSHLLCEDAVGMAAERAPQFQRGSCFGLLQSHPQLMLLWGCCCSVVAASPTLGRWGSTAAHWCTTWRLCQVGYRCPCAQPCHGTNLWRCSLWLARMLSLTFKLGISSRLHHHHQQRMSAVCCPWMRQQKSSRESV